MVRLFGREGCIGKNTSCWQGLCYALDPHEVWKGYNTSKDYSAFVTKTLVNKDGEIKRRIMAMFSGEESGQEQKEATFDGSERPPPEKGDGSPQRAIPMINRPLSSKSHK